MINRIAIQQWSEHAPWINNAQIEQDLIKCRALVAFPNRVMKQKRYNTIVENELADKVLFYEIKR